MKKIGGAEFREQFLAHNMIDSGEAHEVVNKHRAQIDGLLSRDLRSSDFSVLSDGLDLAKKIDIIKNFCIEVTDDIRGNLLNTCRNLDDIIFLESTSMAPKKMSTRNLLRCIEIFLNAEISIEEKRVILGNTLKKIKKGGKGIPRTKQLFISFKRGVSQELKDLLNELSSEYLI